MINKLLKGRCFLGLAQPSPIKANNPPKRITKTTTKQPYSGSRECSGSE